MTSLITNKPDKLRVLSWYVVKGLEPRLSTLVATPWGLSVLCVSSSLLLYFVRVCFFSERIEESYLGTAKGLAYIHVVHRDTKASNMYTSRS